MAGKGGTGKTTTAALAVRALLDLGARSVLAVDADPNACLHEALGVTVERSVGEITEEMLANPEANPGGMGKHAWLELNVQRYLAEAHGFDLLSMGRPEGSGCYCYANDLVRGCIDDLTRGYGYVVMDNEAGLEHLSRRTTRDVDLLLLVSDPSVRGIATAARLSDLADELGIEVGSRYLVIARGAEPLDPALLAAVASSGLALLGVVPADDGVTSCDLAGGCLFDLAQDSPALAAVREMLASVVPVAEGVTT
ncbi:MAG: carbon monoxide dehydrogenase [Coriobacteriaceae bacterium]|nr:carbon monoxide dehydrogenase [Coriobacteriaceae bacterium]